MLLLILLSLMIPHQCDAIASIVLMHGRGECITNGPCHTFAINLQQVLVNKSLTNDYQIVEVGLSNNCNDDQNWSEYTDMTFQLGKLCAFISQDNIMQQLQSSTRIILVGQSQGALLLRGYLWSNCSDPFRNKTDKLITMGGPNNGVFGIPKDFSCNILNSSQLIEFCDILLNIAEYLGAPEYLDLLMYTIFIPILSFASYWNSPSPIYNYLRLNTFLAKINNENSSFNRGLYMEGLTRCLVMIAFGNDDTIVPRISAWFGYWGLSGQYSALPYYQTNVYNNNSNPIVDRIGLKKLDNNGCIILDTIPNASHVQVPVWYIYDRFISYLN